MPTLLAAFLAQVAESGGASADFWPHFVRWVGHFHPMMTEFPIALLLAAALAELIRLLGGPNWLEGASRWCVITGAIGAIITVPLGWALAVGHGRSELLEIHRWLGTAAGAGAVVILFLSEMSRRPDRRGWLAAFRTLLFLAVALVIATGYFGGAMVFGVHAYAWNLPAPHQAEAAASSQPAGNIQVIDMTGDDVFKPDHVTIQTGTIVEWKNISQDPHTVTTDPAIAAVAKDVASPPGVAVFNSGRITPGQTFEHKFTVPGTYKYICEPHEMMGMTGQIVVRAK